MKFMKIKWILRKQNFLRKINEDGSHILFNGIFKYSHETIFIIKLLNETYYLGHVCLGPILNTNILF